MVDLGSGRLLVSANKVESFIASLIREGASEFSAFFGCPRPLPVQAKPDQGGESRSAKACSYQSSARWKPISGGAGAENDSGERSLADMVTVVGQSQEADMPARSRLGTGSPTTRSPGRARSPACAKRWTNGRVQQRGLMSLAILKKEKAKRKRESTINSMRPGCSRKS